MAHLEFRFKRTNQTPMFTYPYPGSIENDRRGTPAHHCIEAVVDDVGQIAIVTCLPFLQQGVQARLMRLGRRRAPHGIRLTGSDFLMDGGVTAS